MTDLSVFPVCPCHRRVWRWGLSLSPRCRACGTQDLYNECDRHRTAHGTVDYPGRSGVHGPQGRTHGTHGGAAVLGAYLHVVTPTAIVVTALLLHALHNALPLLTLLALVSAAYGRLVWRECLEAFLDRERTAGPTGGARADGAHTGSAPSAGDAGGGAARNTLLGVEPTR